MAGVIPMKMIFRGKEDVPTKTTQTPIDENWYQDLKDVPSIALPEKAVVGASMSLNWRMNREEEPAYMEVVSLHVVAFERKGGKMATVAKKPDKELWYHRILRNFVLPRDDDLAAQPAAGAGELSNLGIGPEKKRRVPTTTTTPKKSDAEKAQPSKAKSVGGEKKVMRRPKSEPKDAADIPPSNLDDPIDLESSPEHLLRKKTGKRKQVDVEAEGQPEKKARRKKITRRGNLDAFIAKPVLEVPNSPVYTEPESVVNEELPPSPPRASVVEQLKNADVPENEAEKTVGAEDSGVENPLNIAVDAGTVTSPEVVDVGAGNPQTPEFVAQDSEKGKSAQEIPVTASPSMASNSMLENIEKVSAEDQGSFSDADKNSPIHPDETLGDYYYRTYSEKNAAEIHVPVWNLKKGDTFSDWRVCQDWLQGTFPCGVIKFQEGRLHDQNYHAYLEEVASYTSTTHHIVREWHSMHKEWAAFKASKKKAAEDENRVAQLRAKLEADQAKFETDRKTEEWSVAGWKRKAEAEAALLSEERKNWKKICEKDNTEKMGLRNVINNLKAEVEKLKKQDAEIEKLKQEKANAEAARDEVRSHREMSEQREVHTYATLALRDKEIKELTALLSEQEQLKAEIEYSKKTLEFAQAEKAETSCRLAKTEEKLETSETARAKAESELEPLKGDMLWLKEHGIASVAKSVLNCEELDKTVARLSATHGVNTDAALAAMKTEFNNLQLPVMDLINVALQSEDHVLQLKEIFPDKDEDEDLD
ncbi:uncharacterized protein LOC110923918 [Helianthus annuus]|uniref:uncharacterized protein LOC110923918 n=1 Tax=Helianthus annuus TaxID=4232 RepID=UPI000B902A86|nr:uncharacterized protein LOC110923918 [Helianthus annuus]